jgi:hypothetical protein
MVGDGDGEGNLEIIRYCRGGHVKAHDGQIQKFKVNIMFLYSLIKED